MESLTGSSEVVYVVWHSLGRAIWLRDFLYAAAGQVRPVEVVVVADHAAEGQVRELIQRVDGLVSVRVASATERALTGATARFCALFEDGDIPYPRHASTLSAALQKDRGPTIARGTGYLATGREVDGTYVALQKKSWDSAAGEISTLPGAFMARMEVVRAAIAALGGAEPRTVARSVALAAQQGQSVVVEIRVAERWLIVSAGTDY